jgi:redox-sensitive bicupin YhaK (pirin superfamily)
LFIRTNSISSDHRLVGVGEGHRYCAPTASDRGNHLLMQADPTEPRPAAAASAQCARFLLFAGAPQSTHRVQRGPFVARDAQQLARFVDAFERGGFGRLVPFVDAPFADAPFREDA